MSSTVKPNDFREGDWFDQMRIYSGNGEFVSDYHPNDTVSLFLAKFHTNCGYYELKVLNRDSMQLNKGYFVLRFNDHFYTFAAKISRKGKYLNCDYGLEQRHCKSYIDLNEKIKDINILETDYRNFIYIHQCIDNRNYIMVLAKHQKMTIKKKIAMENHVNELMMENEITIDNQSIWWPEEEQCRKHFKHIHPIFYRKVIFEPIQDICPANLTISLIDLSNYWYEKIEAQLAAWESKKHAMYVAAGAIFFFLSFVGVVLIFFDNVDFK
ncbi:unnamed protein product [Diamesa serratosioi]